MHTGREPVAPNEDMARYWGKAPPGWYTDPERADMLRFWDGAAWSPSTTPRLAGSFPGAGDHRDGSVASRFVRGVRNRIRHP